MIISGEQDIQGLQRIGHIIAVALQELKTKVAPGMTTKDLDNICGHTLQAFGAQPAPMQAYGFPGQLCISVNDEVVHGIPGSRVIQAGDLVKFDLEAEKDGYIADATVATVVAPVGELHQRLADCAEDALMQALNVARAGQPIREIGRVVEKVVRQQGFSVVKELCGHGVGRKVHEKPSVPNYPARDAGQKLTEGLVITIEPIITAGNGLIYQTDDGWTIRSMDGTLASHFEHTIIITDDKPIIVTAL